jgi:hydroxymethylpyrimidine pyrophosphatase-like HAD family hydrolase
MVLPAGMNKAAGLAAALRELDLSPPNVVGVGDAENDHAFLRFCGCDAAVANALPAVKDEADLRLAGRHGDGVIELVDMILRDDGRFSDRNVKGFSSARIARALRSISSHTAAAC